jgi:hypothetical protein
MEQIPPAMSGNTLWSSPNHYGLSSGFFKPSHQTQGEGQMEQRPLLCLMEGGPSVSWCPVLFAFHLMLSHGRQHLLCPGISVIYSNLTSYCSNRLRVTVKKEQTNSAQCLLSSLGGTKMTLKYRSV